MKLLALLTLLSTGCLFTSLHSPRAHRDGEFSIGGHIAAVADSNDTTDGSYIAVGTVRVGTSVGEIGANFSVFGADLSLKVPLISEDGATHLAAIGGIGDYLFIFPEANLGLLLGQEVGPLMPYVGYRQHVFAAGLVTGDAISGLELRVTENVSLVAEVNYNFLFTGDDDDDDLLGAFDIPVVSIGLTIGNGRAPPDEAPLSGAGPAATAAPQ